jgi:hypothetical protein
MVWWDYITVNGFWKKYTSGFERREYFRRMGGCFWIRNGLYKPEGDCGQYVPVN